MSHLGFSWKYLLKSFFFPFWLGRVHFWLYVQYLLPFRASLIIVRFDEQKFLIQMYKIHLLIVFYIQAHLTPLCFTDIVLFTNWRLLVTLYWANLLSSFFQQHLLTSYLSHFGTLESFLALLGKVGNTHRNKRKTRETFFKIYQDTWVKMFLTKSFFSKEEAAPIRLKT